MEAISYSDDYDSYNTDSHDDAHVDAPAEKHADDNHDHQDDHADDYPEIESSSLAALDDWEKYCMQVS